MNRSRFLIIGLLCAAVIGVSVHRVSAAASQPAAPQFTVPKVPTVPKQSMDSVIAWDAPLKQLAVSNGTPQAHFSFSLTNISAANVVISNVQTSCGCTVARLPAQPWTIAPGAGGEIDVTVDLAGKSGTLIKTITVYSDKGSKILYVRPTILPPVSTGEMDGVNRTRNQQLAIADRQAVFKGQCASCHVEPAKGKVGQALYQSACGICHESEHRASMVPNLHAIPEPTNAEFWRNWIAHGKPGTLMPAFAQSEGGILSDAQITSLVAYLTAAIPSGPRVQHSQAAMPPK